MQYAVIGLNHNTAPVSVREQLALGGDRLERALAMCLGRDVLAESVVLSTCNRVEFYVATHQSNHVMNAVKDVLAEVCDVSRGSMGWFDRHLYHHQEEEALRHLFRVASSLDSMVIGESQILGQLKEAFAQAREAGTVERFLDRAMTRAFAVAKKVRSETRISEGGISISYVASQLASKIFGSLSGRAVLLVGAGEMAELAAMNLSANGASRIKIANRSLGRAEALASRLNGVAHPLEALPELLLECDIVITSTGANRPILHRSTISTIARARKYRPLFIIDIAVPRDVESAAGEVDGVYLYDVDDLKQVADANMAARRREADAAERLVEEELSRFTRWLGEADVVPTIVGMRRRFTAIKEAELEQALGGKLNHLTAAEKKAVEVMANRLVNKLLHGPTVKLKAYAGNGARGQEAVDVLQALFELEEPPEEEDAAAVQSAPRLKAHPKPT